MVQRVMAKNMFALKHLDQVDMNRDKESKNLLSFKSYFI